MDEQHITDNLIWRKTPLGVVIEGTAPYVQLPEDFTISSSFDGVAVTAIGEAAFK